MKFKFYLFLYKIFIVGLFFVSSLHASESSLNALEYFFDTDPGVGQGQMIQTTGESSHNINLDISNLSPGLHTLFVRAKNSDDNWGFAHARPFYIQPEQEDTSSEMTQAEYYIDHDPGFGNGTPITINQTKTTTDIDISELDKGMHIFYVRLKNSDGAWGMSQARLFFISFPPDDDPQNNLTKIEYFFDNDFGTGNGVQINLDPDSGLQQYDLDVTNLQNGMHQLYVRAYNGETWGLVQSRPFFLQFDRDSVIQPVVHCEYFFDNDDGFGNGISLNTGDANKIEEQINIDHLSSGLHRLYVRSSDSEQWGTVQSRPIFVAYTETENQRTIQHVEFFFDHEDPGFGHASPIPVLTSESVWSVNHDIFLWNRLPTGNHTFHVRAQNDHSVWGGIQSADFYYEAVEVQIDPPSLSNISDVSSLGDIISFTVVNAQSGEITITALSSDQTIIPYTGIHLCGSNKSVVTKTLSAGMTQTLSLTLLPNSDQHDRITITVIATDSSGLTSSTNFSVIVSPPGSGNALEFDDDSDYISLGSIDGSHPLALVGTNFSLCFWMKPTLTGDDWQRILDKSISSTDHYSVYIHTDYKLRIKVGSNVVFISEAVLEADKWQHIAITMDGASYLVYHNGRLLANNATDPFTTPTNATGTVLMGKSTNTDDRIYDGILDEFSIWNRALTVNEIRQNMCQKLIGNENGLLAYYRFDSSQGSTLLDLSGNEYDATLVGKEENDWVTSGAPLGYSSVYDYVGTNPNDFSMSMSHSNGDALTAIGDGGNYSGIHIYLVNDSPNNTTPPASFQSMDTSHYFGIFTVGNSATYSMTYYYGNNTYTNENEVLMAFRENGADTDWNSLLTILDTQRKELSCPYVSIHEGYPASEFIFGTEAINLITDDLVAYYPFNTNANDETGNGNNGNIFGARLVADRNGFSDGAYRLDGSDDWIRLQDFNVPETFSVSMWLDIQNTTDNQCIVGKTDTSESNYLFMGLFNGGKYHVGIRGTTYNYGASTPGYHLITFVVEKIDASNSLVTVFVDQSIKWQQIINETLGSSITGNKWTLGQDWDSGPTKSDFFKGILDEVSFYNRALNANEIRYLYNLQPTLSAIESPTYVSNTVTLTITTEESTQVTITARSSDQTIISDSQINLGGSGSNQFTVTTNASTPTAITLTMTKVPAMYGRVIITCSVIGTSGLTETRNFPVIISPPGAGMALEFDGINDYVDLDSIPGSDPMALTGGELTFSFWVKPTLSGNSTQRIIDKSNDTYGHCGYGLSILSTGKLLFYTNDATRLETTEGAIKANIWQHISVTGDGSTYTCYINGYAVPVTYPNAYSAPPTTTTDARIGSAAVSSSRYFQGQFDELSIWSRSFSASEIRQNMCQRLSGNENGLLAYYRFDHTVGTTLSDLSGNGYHGVLTNMSDSDWVTSGAALGDGSTFPKITTSMDQSMNEDSSIQRIRLTVTDAETVGCSFSITYSSSNTTLISTENISYTCHSGIFYISLTPTTNQSGISIITITVTNNDGLSATTSCVVRVSTAPTLTSIPDQNTAAGTIRFMCHDDEADEITITATSSNQTVLPNSGIILTGSTNNSTLHTLAGVAHVLTLAMTPNTNQHDRVTITLTATDSAGLSDTTTFTVIVSPPGAGYALNFDGIDDFIDLGNMTSSDPLALAGSDFTFSLWIKPTLTGDTYQKIIDKSDGLYGEGGYTLQIEPDGMIKLQIEGTLTSQYRAKTDSGILQANQWQHIAVTGNGSSYKCYVNGISVSLDTKTYQSPVAQNTNMRIGNYTGSNKAYSGLVDEVQIWNKALSQSEIRQNMCQKLTGNESNLLLYYRFDHISGTTIKDLSGNGYHGTLTNMESNDWVTSGASLGDRSIYDYDGSIPSEFDITLSHSDGDTFHVTGAGGTFEGIQLYLVNELSNASTSYSGFQTDHYWGVFIEGSFPTYDIEYDYKNHQHTPDTAGLGVFSRRGNTDTSWASRNTSNDTINNILTSKACSGTNKEYIVLISNYPQLSTVDDLVVNDGTLISAIPIRITGTETSACSYDIAFHSSTTNLISVENISYTCAENILYLSIIPTSSQTGTATISIDITDSKNHASSISFRVNVNDLPLFGIISDQTINEDTSIVAIPFTATGGDCNLNIQFISSNTNLVPENNISYICTSDNYYLSITPTTDNYGSTSITMMVIDQQGLTASTSFTLDVLPINDSPVAYHSEFFTTQNQSISGQFNAFDIDSSFLSYTIVSNPVKGTVRVINASEFIYIPFQDKYGEDSFSYQVHDNENAVSNTAIVSIYITSINAPPVAYGKDIVVNEDMHIYIKLVATDDNNDTLTYHILSPPSHGTVSLNGANALYTPRPHYNGPDEVTFKVCDGITDSNTAAIMITVYPVYDIPQAIKQEVTTTENMPVNITLTGYSPDNKALTFQIKNQPEHGILTQLTPYLTYTPDTHFYGTDSFSFIANDSISDSSPATVSITVERRETYLLELIGTGYGTVRINSSSVLLPWDSQFQADQKVCFEAIPDTDWKFVNWTGDLQSNENPACVILDQNKTITATMTIKTFELTIQGSKPITINHSFCSLPFSEIFEIHAPIMIQTASELFKYWEIDTHIIDNPYFFNINENMTINAHYYPVPDWQANIQVERLVDNPTIVQSQSVIIGTASQAYTRSAPDLPDNYSCDIVLYDQDFNAFSKDIHLNTDGEYQWIIAVDPHGNNENPLIVTTASIKWDPDDFSSEGQYVLKSDTTNEILISDMRQTTEYQFTNNSYKPFTIIWHRFKTFDFHLDQGWNLISIPLIPSNTAIKNLFPDCRAAYEYKNGGYCPVTNIIPGKGYWLKIPSQKTYSISGQPFPSYTIELSDGWHLIGAAYDEITPETNSSINVIFYYVNGGYQQAFTLMPGFGYWVKIK